MMLPLDDDYNDDDDGTIRGGLFCVVTVPGTTLGKHASENWSR